jgi:hypothetical protein
VTALTRSGCAEATIALLWFRLRQTAAPTAQPSEPLPPGEVHFQAIEVFELLLLQQQQHRVINLVSSNFDQLSKKNPKLGSEISKLPDPEDSLVFYGKYVEIQPN